LFLDRARIAADMVDHLAAKLTADTAPNRLICVAR
jgi:hypothetical protein